MAAVWGWMGTTRVTSEQLTGGKETIRRDERGSRGSVPGSRGWDRREGGGEVAANSSPQTETPDSRVSAVGLACSGPAFVWLRFQACGALCLGAAVFVWCWTLGERVCLQNFSILIPPLSHRGGSHGGDAHRRTLTEPNRLVGASQHTPSHANQVRRSSPGRQARVR